jgi:hypothetical protein
MTLCKHRSDEEDSGFAFPAGSLYACRDFRALQRGEPAEPEKKLMLAMLEDALRCREKYRDAKDRRGKKLFREAEEWLLSETEDWIFSIGNVCEALGLNPAYIRKYALHEVKKHVEIAASNREIGEQSRRRGIRTRAVLNNGRLMGFAGMTAQS